MRAGSFIDESQVEGMKLRPHTAVNLDTLEEIPAVEAVLGPRQVAVLSRGQKPLFFDTKKERDEYIAAHNN